ncbi:hypothetical protein BDF14DRAFT_1810784 [Spinellus fusiger]|nr:hypothetical protein BDF14DRAFT_1810784 [Spinellus fusiger]
MSVLSKADSDSLWEFDAPRYCDLTNVNKDISLNESWFANHLKNIQHSVSDTINKSTEEKKPILSSHDDYPQVSTGQKKPIPSSINQSSTSRHKLWPKKTYSQQEVAATSQKQKNYLTNKSSINNNINNNNNPKYIDIKDKQTLEIPATPTVSCLSQKTNIPPAPPALSSTQETENNTNGIKSVDKGKKKLETAAISSSLLYSTQPNKNNPRDAVTTNKTKQTQEMITANTSSISIPTKLPPSNPSLTSKQTVSTLARLSRNTAASSQRAKHNNSHTFIKHSDSERVTTNSSTTLHESGHRVNSATQPRKHDIPSKNFSHRPEETSTQHGHSNKHLKTHPMDSKVRKNKSIHVPLNARSVVEKTHLSIDKKSKNIVKQSKTHIHTALGRDPSISSVKKHALNQSASSLLRNTEKSTHVVNNPDLSTINFPQKTVTSNTKIPPPKKDTAIHTTLITLKAQEMPVLPKLDANKSSNLSSNLSKTHTTNKKEDKQNISLTHQPQRIDSPKENRIEQVKSSLSHENAFNPQSKAQSKTSLSNREIHTNSQDDLLVLAKKQVSPPASQKTDFNPKIMPTALSTDTKHQKKYISPSRENQWKETTDGYTSALQRKQDMDTLRKDMEKIRLQLMKAEESVRTSSLETSKETEKASAQHSKNVWYSLNTASVEDKIQRALRVIEESKRRSRHWPVFRSSTSLKRQSSSSDPLKINEEKEEKPSTIESNEFQKIRKSLYLPIESTVARSPVFATDLRMNLPSRMNINHLQESSYKESKPHAGHKRSSLYTSLGTSLNKRSRLTVPRSPEFLTAKRGRRVSYQEQSTAQAHSVTKHHIKPSRSIQPHDIGKKVRGSPVKLSSSTSEKAPTSSQIESFHERLRVWQERVHQDKP